MGVKRKMKDYVIGFIVGVVITTLSVIMMFI